MCGIVGLINYNNKELLMRMNQAQTHRGPDFEGHFWDGDNLIGLAMRRLSIVDIGNGKQPMTNEDGRVILIFNGEIFNAPILREKLIQRGHKFKTVSSDTEVLVHLYEEYGISMLNMLNGMFAFAIYDKNKKIIFIARDHMGIKPLHYIYDGKRLAFASEIKSLHAAGLAGKEIDQQGVWHYLSFQCVPAPLTIYKEIKVLPNAHYLLYNIEDCSIKIEKYWDCIENRQIYNGTTQELKEYVATNVEEAVERWTMSDVPLACSLSGGLDSSIIAAIVSKKHDLHTYSLGFTDCSEYDERMLALELSQKYGFKHEEILLTSGDLLKDMDSIIQSMDVPYAGGLPSWFVFKKIAGNEKVVFNGTGGDELFGNYSKWLRYEHPFERLRKYKQFLEWGESPCEYLRTPSASIYHKYMTERMKKCIVSFPYADCENTNEYLEKLLGLCPSKEWRDKVPYVDFKIQLPEEFLMMLDRFSMHFSLEARVPFLDRDLVEKMLGIPGKIRTQRYNVKYLLKEAMGELLPDSYLSATKRGFVLPYREWLQNDLKEAVYDLCTGEYIRKQGIFSKELEKNIIIPFYDGKDHLTPIVWTVLMFQLWYQNEIVSIC